MRQRFSYEDLSSDVYNQLVAVPKRTSVYLLLVLEV